MSFLYTQKLALSFQDIFTIEYEPRSGGPTTSRDPVTSCAVILDNKRISPRKIAQLLGICREHVGSIGTNILHMRKLSAKWVPKCLNSEQWAFTHVQSCGCEMKTLGFQFAHHRSYSINLAPSNYRLLSNSKKKKHLKRHHSDDIVDVKHAAESWFDLSRAFLMH